MFRELLGDAFPVLEKFAPSIAAILGSFSTPSLLVLNVILMIAKILKPEQDSFNINDLKQWILTHPDCEELLTLAEKTLSSLLDSSHDDDEIKH